MSNQPVRFYLNVLVQRTRRYAITEGGDQAGATR
jgi:hypothetical protein